MVPFQYCGLIIVTCLMALGGCNRKRPVVVPSTETAVTSSPPREASSSPSDLPRSSSDDSDASRTERIAAARAVLTAQVYFNYDQAKLTEEAMRVLSAKLSILAASPSVILLLSGHADERGSDEYNIALGQRRAAAVRQYLLDHGIAPGRLTITSYGEERPACQFGGEACWSLNRRVEFDITAGADRIVVR